MTTIITTSDLVNENVYFKLSETSKNVLLSLEKYISNLNQTTESDVDYLMKYLFENSRKLNFLLKKDKKLSKKIETRLDLYSFYKRSFSKNQIKLYNDYIKLKNSEKLTIKNNLSFISDKDLKKQLVYSVANSKTDFKDIANKLIIILTEQNKTIKILTKITSKASKLLKTFDIADPSPLRKN